MSLSLFFAIASSNKTNTLSHTQNHILNQPALMHPESHSGLGEEQCRLGRARMQETLYVCVAHSPGWACRDSRHREQAAEGIPIIPCSPYKHTLRTNPHHHGSTLGDNSCTTTQDKHQIKKIKWKIDFDWHSKPSTHDKHICIRAQRGSTDKQVERQQDTEDTDRQPKGRGTVRQKAEKEQVERP